LDGWISRYGRINGGTYFFTDLFGRDTTSAQISWNMTGAPEGMWMTMIDVFGIAEDGTYWENIYGVRWNYRFLNPGDTVTVHEGVNIQAISFFGSNTIPDAGSTLLLFGSAVAALIVLPKFRRV
jgi:hypothetical protein